MHHIVYKLTSPSGKVYIGLTSKSLNDRVRTHQRDRARLIKKANQLPRFYASWVKYPIEDWKREILHEELTRAEAGKYETQEIFRHNSLSEHFGYNMTKGGDGGDTGKNGDITKRKEHSLHMKRLCEDSAYVERRIAKSKLTVKQNPAAFKINCEKRKRLLRRGSQHQNHTGLWVVRFNLYETLHTAVSTEGISESTIIRFCNNPDRVALGANKYLNLNQCPRQAGFYKIQKGENNGKV